MLYIWTPYIRKIQNSDRSISNGKVISGFLDAEAWRKVIRKKWGVNANGYELSFLVGEMF